MDDTDAGTAVPATDAQQTAVLPVPTADLDTSQQYITQERFELFEKNLFQQFNLLAFTMEERFASGTAVPEVASAGTAVPESPTAGTAVPGGSDTRTAVSSAKQARLAAFMAAHPETQPQTTIPPIDHEGSTPDKSNESEEIPFLGRTSYGNTPRPTRRVSGLFCHTSFVRVCCQRVRHKRFASICFPF